MSLAYIIYYMCIITRVQGKENVYKFPPYTICTVCIYDVPICDNSTGTYVADYTL